MEYFTITAEELFALDGLPYMQQILYFRGIRPYMDRATGIVGIKRRISYQSIREALYVEPIAGVKTYASPSYDQVRRAVKQLIKNGLLEIQPARLQLVFKCVLALKNRSVQNKAATMSPEQVAINPLPNAPDLAQQFNVLDVKDARSEYSQADIPHNNNYIYIFLYTNFEKFWELYPLKKDKAKAFKLFQKINPDEKLVSKILESLQLQISFYQNKLSQGAWTPNWKYPANWLLGACWEDEILEEATHATRKTNSAKESRDFFWESCKGGADFDEEEFSSSNIIQFSKRAKTN